MLYFLLNAFTNISKWSKVVLPVVRVRSTDRIPEKEYMEEKLEILHFYRDSH